MRRWNLTIIIVVCAFVLGIAAGYTYRDQFAPTRIVGNENPATSSAELESQLFNSHVAELLKPTSSLEAKVGSNEVYSLTGRVTKITAEQLDIEVPSDTLPDDDTLQFTLLPETEYATLSISEAADGTRIVTEAPLTRSDVAVGAVVAVYTQEDIMQTERPHVNKVQKLNDQ